MPTVAKCNKKSGWLGLLVLLTASSVWADDGAQWLERMVQAEREQSYHGSYIYERPGVFTTQDIWRQVDQSGVHERLLQTAERYLEWVRLDGQLECATNSVVAQGKPNSAPVTLDADQLGQWYNIRILGGTRIASRPVTVIAVQPRDAFRYAHEFYLDNETGLMLKSLLVDDSRELLERFQFASISFAAADYQAGLKPSSSCRTVGDAQMPDASGVVFREPAWLPPGFVLEDQQIQLERSESSSPMISQTYSDGLASFTLFLEPLKAVEQAEDIQAQLGPTVAVSRRLMGENGILLATVVGEIPPRSAERIAESLGESGGGIAR